VHNVGGDEPTQHRVTGYIPREHRVRPPVARIGAIAGGVAVVVGVALGTAMLITKPAAVRSADPTAEHITVSATPTLPLSDTQLVDLTRQPPEYGALMDPQHRASCLNGLGYPASTQILGARPIELGGQPAVVFVLEGDTPSQLVALAVRPNCSSADTGLIANTRITRP
jgi:hypothetical protein